MVDVVAVLPGELAKHAASEGYFIQNTGLVLPIRVVFRYDDK